MNSADHDDDEISDSNAYERLTDLESNRAYRYKNLKSNFLAKKK